MKKARIILAALLSLILLCSVAACSKKDANTTAPAQKASLTVSAAASLKDSMDEVKANYAKENPNVTVTINYGASGTLEQQIEQGADVDVFISAATKQIDQLKTKGLTMDDTIKNLLGNKLVLIVPSDSKANITDFSGVTGEGIKKLALGEAKSVPAGQYAEEVFTKLNILDQVKGKAVYGKDVKEVLTWVATGNADAGVVYATDAKTSDKVKVVAVAADGTHTPIVYPATVIKTSKNADVAKAFMAYLSGPQAKAVFEKYGFTVLAK
ncbi:MAG: molybdate ABC transporter substrate-binding protein [Syntrophomonadaceae bacterium]